MLWSFFSYTINDACFFIFILLLIFFFFFAAAAVFTSSVRLFCPNLFFYPVHAGLSSLWWGREKNRCRLLSFRKWRHTNGSNIYDCLSIPLAHKLKIFCDWRFISAWIVSCFSFLQFRSIRSSFVQLLKILLRFSYTNTIDNIVAIW